LLSPPGVGQRGALPVEPAHQHVFELDELLDAMARALAADARFLDAVLRPALRMRRRVAFGDQL